MASRARLSRAARDKIDALFRAYYESLMVEPLPKRLLDIVHGYG